MPSEGPMQCGLCERPFLRPQLTKHHCLPREEGGTSDHVALICRQCHGMVHATYTNRTLAATYPTIAELRRAPELEKYIRWVRRQPATRRTRNKKRRQQLKRDLEQNPAEAHESEFSFGRDTSTGLNGLDQDATRRPKDAAEDDTISS